LQEALAKNKTSLKFQDFRLKFANEYIVSLDAFARKPKEWMAKQKAVRKTGLGVKISRRALESSRSIIPHCKKVFWHGDWPEVIP
jgi:hypothetical protein